MTGRRGVARRFILLTIFIKVEDVQSAFHYFFCKVLFRCRVQQILLFEAIVDRCISRLSYPFAGQNLASILDLASSHPAQVLIGLLFDSIKLICESSLSGLAVLCSSGLELWATAGLTRNLIIIFNKVVIFI